MPKQSPLHPRRKAAKPDSTILTGPQRVPVELRQSILAAALELFATQGYDATSVSDIVAHVGFTKGALYHHFESKEEILLELEMAYIENRVGNARRIVEAHTAAEDRLRHLIREAIGAVDMFRDHVAIFAQERRFLSRDSFAAVRQKRDELEAIYVGVLRQGITEGVFTAKVEPRLATFFLLGILTGAYSWYRPDGALSADGIADHLYRFVISGLGVPPGRAG